MSTNINYTVYEYIHVCKSSLLVLVATKQANAQLYSILGALQY